MQTNMTATTPNVTMSYILAVHVAECSVRPLKQPIDTVVIVAVGHGEGAGRGEIFHSLTCRRSEKK